jgi:hypothetical protein
MKNLKEQMLQLEINNVKSLYNNEDTEIVSVDVDLSVESYEFVKSQSEELGLTIDEYTCMILRRHMIGDEFGFSVDELKRFSADDVEEIIDIATESDVFIYDIGEDNVRKKIAVITKVKHEYQSAH